MKLHKILISILINFYNRSTSRIEKSDFGLDKPFSTATIMGIFAIISGLIAIVNHYLFRTGAFDYGIIHTLMYDFLHFNTPEYGSDYYNKTIHAFSDHFSPLLAVFSPLSLLFGTYTMIILTIAAFVWGGYGIFRYSMLKTDNRVVSNLFMIHFFVLWGLYSSLAFPGHMNDLAAMAVPWLFFAYEKRNLRLTVLLFFIILLSKENMALYASFIVLCLYLRDIVKKNRPKTILLLLFAGGIIYFIAIVFYVMPLFDKPGMIFQLTKYNTLGNSAGEMLSTAFTRPLYVISLFFNNTNPDPVFNGIKAEFYLMLFISGGLTFLNQPWYLVIVLPMLALKMFHSDPALWGINYHYSIEFVPLISLSVIDFVTTYTKTNRYKTFAMAIAFLALVMTIAKMDHRKSTWYDAIATRFYQIKHYKTELNTGEIYDVIRQIPENATLSASTKIYPHLALRDTIYHFPNINKAAYIVVILNNENCYPLTVEAYFHKIESLKKSDEYVIDFQSDDLLILKRKSH